MLKVNRCNQVIFKMLCKRLKTTEDKIKGKENNLRKKRNTKMRKI
jgi:hypothetical protein